MQVWVFLVNKFVLTVWYGVILGFFVDTEKVSQNGNLEAGYVFVGIVFFKLKDNKKIQTIRHKGLGNFRLRRFTEKSVRKRNNA